MGIEQVSGNGISGLKTSAQASNPFQEPNMQQMPKPTEGQTRTLAGGIAGGIADGYQVVPGNTGGQTPGDSGNPNLTLRPCPANVSVSNIEIMPVNIKINTPGFVGMPSGNVPATFKILRGGAPSNTVCYCEYELGELLVKIQTDLTGYTSCSAGGIGMAAYIKLYK